MTRDYPIRFQFPTQELLAANGGNVWTQRLPVFCLNTNCN